MDWLSERQLSGAVLDALTASICVVDQNGMIVAVNQAWRRFSSDNGGRGAFLGENYLDVCRRAKGPGAKAAQRFGQNVADVLFGRRERFETEYPCHSPKVRRWFLARVTRLHPADTIADPDAERVAVVTHQDITTRKLLEFDLKKLAETDELTGLKNRRRFLAAANKALERLKRFDAPASLFIIDLDNFKTINDTHGHAVGDGALCHAAERFKRAIRRRDLLARIGGEEFAVLLPDEDECGAMMVAERLRTLIAASPLSDKSGPIGLTVSVGVTSLRKGDQSADDALGRADRALYRAKDEGRNRVRASTMGLAPPTVP
ncbi:sensor domain-containing diguanylate cyclase [Pelagibacterium montanilacus]|uniref:sensor domain-containing diguanylate cyclase n=1 Tax=Pelagibacterium montanilacus TaxID=2185280 RepID=UPI0013DF9DB6|nr:sensor domain-containing diguanylate cyclase [Pelagibacterium montanilacus]